MPLPSSGLCLEQGSSTPRLQTGTGTGKWSGQHSRWAAGEAASFTLITAWALPPAQLPPVEKLSFMKLVSGAKKVGEHWSRYYNILTYFQCLVLFYHHQNIAWILRHNVKQDLESQILHSLHSIINNQDKIFFLKLFRRKILCWRTICSAAESHQPTTICTLLRQ